jgi:hypothetical protein
MWSAIVESVAPPMKNVRVKSIAIGALIALFAAGAIALWSRCPSDPGAILLVECSHRGGYSETDYWWHLSLDGSGNGNLVIDERLRTSEKGRAISVPLAELQKAVRECRLCELPSVIGVPAVDSPTSRMRIKTTNLDKTITFEWVEPRNVKDDDRRAFRLWNVIYHRVDNRNYIVEVIGKHNAVLFTLGKFSDYQNAQWCMVAWNDSHWDWARMREITPGGGASSAK